MDAVFTLPAVYDLPMPSFDRPVRQVFEQVVERTLDELPDHIAAKINNLTVVVEDRPEPENDPCGQCLLGLYHGISLAERGMDYAGVLPDRISVYISSHLALNLDQAETEKEVRRTLLHEIGHHLGIDDRRLEELGWG